MPADYEFGPFRLDAKLGILLRGTEPIGIGQRAVALLRLLVERAGEPVAKEDLIAAAWPGLAIEDSNLTARRPGRRPRLSLHRRRLSQPQNLRSSPVIPNRPLALPSKPSVVVLPFANLGDDPEQSYFTDGMVDDIITGLSRIKWLFVIGRGTTFAYRRRMIQPREVGFELGVRYLLEGRVRKSGDRVRINCQLVDAASGVQVWAERYDRQLDDLFALQDEIAAAVVGAMDEARRDRARSTQAAR